MGDKDTIKLIINQNNFVITKLKLSRKFKAISGGTILTIAALFIMLPTAIIDFRPALDAIHETIDPKVEKTSSHEDPYSYDKVLSDFEKNQPFSLSWTDCKWDEQPNQSFNHKNTVFLMKPVILDKDGKQATIPFNTKYHFEISLLGDNGYEYKLDSITIDSHIVEPSNREYVKLNMSDIFKSAELRDPLFLKLILTEASFAPYSTKTSKNVIDYTNNYAEKEAVEFTYFEGPDYWYDVKRDDIKDANICYGLMR